jgi:tetratricopeptide (TPR) repeat protein
LAFLEKHRALVNEREDLLVEYITLLNFSGCHEDALEILLSHHFHPWEGGEGKVTGQYVLSLVEMAKELLGAWEPRISERNDRTGQGRAAHQAIELLERARRYPANLGEGKLQGAQENQILYWLGVAHEQAGDTSSAVRCWKESSAGMKTPVPAVYYNDQNPETIFYQGLAFQKLGKPAAAAKRFETLARFGREHLKDEIEIDYFAVSLPEFMVFDDDLNQRNQINCRYLLALGCLGLGKIKQARTELRKLLALDPSHLSAKLHCRSEIV